MPVPAYDSPSAVRELHFDADAGHKEIRADFVTGETFIFLLDESSVTGEFARNGVTLLRYVVTEDETWVDVPDPEAISQEDADQWDAAVRALAEHPEAEAWLRKDLAVSSSFLSKTALHRSCNDDCAFGGTIVTGGLGAGGAAACCTVAAPTCVPCATIVGVLAGMAGFFTQQACNKWLCE